MQLLESDMCGAMVGGIVVLPGELLRELANQIWTLE